MRTSVSARMIWTAAGALLLALVLETPAHGQFDLGVILATLTELNQTMSVTVGGPLAATAATTQQMGAFQQQTMYPTPAIQQALSFAKSLASVMTAAQNLFRTPVNSATLPQTIALGAAVAQRKLGERRFDPKQLHLGIWRAASLDRNSGRQPHRNGYDGCPSTSGDEEGYCTRCNRESRRAAFSADDATTVVFCARVGLSDFSASRCLEPPSQRVLARRNRTTVAA